MPLVAARKARLQLINLDDGSPSVDYQLVSRVSTATIIGVCAYVDGVGVHTEYYDSVWGGLNLTHAIPDGNSFAISSSETPPVSINDVCFDGVYYWFLTSTTVYQVLGPLGTSTVVDSWAHGLTSPAGIATNGKELIIMEP